MVRTKKISATSSKLTKQSRPANWLLLRTVYLRVTHSMKVFRPLITASLLIGLAVSTTTTAANQANNSGFSKPYLGFDATLMDVNIADDSADTYMLTTKIGFAIRPQIFLEAQYSTSASDDKILNTKVDVENVTALYVVLVSDPIHDVTADFMLGYAQADLAVEGSTDISESLSSAAFGIGLNQRYPHLPHLNLRLDYKVLYNADDVSINALSLGISYLF